MTPAVRILLLSARDSGGVLAPGYVAAGRHKEDMDELRRRGWFVGDQLTEAGAVVAAGLNWEETK